MNPLPAPKVPGDTEAERMDNAVRKMFSVPAQVIREEKTRAQESRKKKKQAAKKPH